jgi:single-strand DNA-binding protein
MNEFFGRGNLGASPVLKHVQVEGEQRPVAELRVYFDRSIPTDDGYTDNGGFWLNVNLWGSRAENAVKILGKGMRVAVRGTLVQSQWTDKDTGQERQGFQLQARSVDLDLWRVESLELRPKEADDDDIATE